MLACCVLTAACGAEQPESREPRIGQGARDGSGRHALGGLLMGCPASGAGWNEGASALSAACGMQA